MAIISICAGLGVGILSGLLGIGGGTILVALFSLGYGMPAIYATATSLFTIIPTSLSGAITHLREKTCVLGVGIAAGIGGAITSPIGVWLASLSPEWLVLIACACVIAYSAISMFQKGFALRAKLRKQRDHSFATGECAECDTGNSVETPKKGIPAEALPIESSDEFNADAVVFAKSAGIGLLAGLLSGYVGVGGGFLMIPLFMTVLRLPMRLASGSSLLAMILLATPGTVLQAVLGNIVWVVGICIAIGSIPGAVLGAKLSKHVSELYLRFGFGAFLIVVAVFLAIEQFV